MKQLRFVPFLTMTFFLLTSLQSRSQQITNTTVLQRMSVESAQQEKENQKRLLALAKQKGWPLTITGRNGKHAVLTGVDQGGYPLYITVFDNTISAATIRTDQLWPGGSTGLNLSGSSANMKGRIGIWDEGEVRATHVELTGRVVQKDNATNISDHSTHVAGTLIASGVNPVAKGMSFGAQQLLAYDFNNDASEMITAAGAANNMIVSNHSYGRIAGWFLNTDENNRWEFYGKSGDTADYKFGYYSSNVQLWDSIAYNAPYYLIVMAAGNNHGENGPPVGSPYWRFNAAGVMSAAGNRPAGISFNDGYDVIPEYVTSKNTVGVGAVYPIPGGYTKPSDVVLAYFSNWGPTDDGRIKPDFVADGVNVLSSFGSSDNAYGIADGTSMASPAAAGSSFLLQEYYSKQHAGAFMRSATLKGLLIHTSDEAGLYPGPDYQFGWGLLNLKKAASVITSNNTDQLIQENNLLNGGTYSLPVVASGKGVLSATICWTDPKGAVDNTNVLNNPAKKLINDLDLRITDGTNTYMPWILSRTNPSAAATTGDNSIDNVENIVVSIATPGKSYTLKVTHKGTLARGQQAYSLIVSGVGGQAYCASAATNSAGTRIDSVSIGTLHHANPTGCTTYKDYTSVAAQLPTNQTAVPLYIKLNSCDATTASRVVKVYIDFNNNGLFTDAGENVATSAVLAGGSVVFTSTVNIPNIAVGNFCLMRIVAEETASAAAVAPCGTYGNGETEDFRIQIVRLATDMGISALVAPGSSPCATDSQYVSVRIKNYGSAPQINIPVTTTIKSGAVTVATLSAIFKDTVQALDDIVFTYASPIKTIAGSTYTYTSKTTLSGDQDPTNDQNITTLTVSAASAPPGAVAELCGTNQVTLKANLTDSNDVPVWYDSINGKVPIAYGPKTSTNIITPNKTYYMAVNDLNMAVGPVNNKVFPSGGYNSFSGNFINFTNKVPLIITTARLYIGYRGKISFTVADIFNVNKVTGGFSYYPISTTTLDVYPTTPNPKKATTTDGNPADPLDTGAVYLLNLPVPYVGDHSIFITIDDSATIFRNNNIAANPYPMSIPGVFSITGNSAIDQTDTNNVTFYQKYYYFFYNMHVQLVNCPSSRIAVVAADATAPVISLNGNVFTSSVGTGNKWYLNGIVIPGATGQTYSAISSGTYYTVVTDSTGCAAKSNSIDFVSTGVVDVNGTEISLVVSPNPNNGQFNVQFTVDTRDDLYMSLINVVGQTVYSAKYPNFVGSFSQQVNAGNLSSGVYILKIVQGKKTYVKKLLIR